MVRIVEFCMTLSYFDRCIRANWICETFQKHPWIINEQFWSLGYVTFFRPPFPVLQFEQKFQGMELLFWKCSGPFFINHTSFSLYPFLYTANILFPNHLLNIQIIFFQLFLELDIYTNPGLNTPNHKYIKTNKQTNTYKKLCYSRRMFVN